MQEQTKRLGVIAGFTLMLVILVVNAVVVRRQLRIQAQNHTSVAHTLQVELAIATLESLLRDAETGQREYLYTQDAAYLLPYEASKGRITEDLDALQQLTADNPTQQRHVADLRSLSKQKIDELQRTPYRWLSPAIQARHAQWFDRVKGFASWEALEE